MSKLKKLNQLNKSKTLSVALSVGLVASNLVAVAPTFAAAPSNAIMSSSRTSNKATASTPVFNKLDPQDVKVTVSTDNPLTAIKLGSASLTEGTDYTLDGDKVTIKADYLKNLSNGSKSFKFDFESGSDKTVKITVTDKSATISAKFATFNNSNDKGKDVSVTVKTNGLTLKGISNGTAALDDSDYTVGSVSSSGAAKVTISKDYLKTLITGNYTLNFDYGAGTAPKVTLKVLKNDDPVNRDATLASVSAVNGTITATLTKAADAVASDFVVKQSIDGATATTLTPTLKMDGAVATLSVAPVVATTAEQTVVYSVSYKGGTAKPVTVKVDPITGVYVTNVSAVNDITVDNGTAADKIGLPAQVDVTLSDKTTAKANVTWDTSKYDGTKAGDITINGTVSAPDGATFTVPADKAAITAKVTVKEAVTALAVSNVSAVNTKQVQVTFNTAVDPTSAQAGANYVIGGGALVADPNGAVLQPDGKTVILNITGDPGLTNFQSYTLTVSNVKDTNGNKIAATSKTFTVSDTAVPAISSVTPKGNTTVVIKFSEPVKNANSVTGPNLTNIQLDGAVIPTANLVGAAPTISADGTTATLVFTGALTAGDHKISILQAGAGTDIMAYAGYKVPSVTQTITVVPDTSAATVTSITASSQTSVTVTFSKPVNVNPATDLADFYWNQSNSAADNAKSADKITTTDNQTYTLSFTAANKPLIAGNVYFFVNGVKDYSGNGIAGNVAANTYGTTVTVPANAQPSVTSVSSKGNNTIYVNYSTAMDPTTARNSANYLVKDSQGNIVNVTNAAWVAGTNDQKQIQLTTASMTTGTYNVAISGVKDVVGNTLSAPTNSVSVTDTSSPAFSAISRNGNAITITFNRAMSVTGTNSVLNVANYQFTPAATGVEGDLPAGTTITAFNSNKSVLITIPAATVVADTDAITIGYLSGTTLYTIADANGNLYTPDPAAGHQVGATAGAVTIGDGAGAALKIVDSSTLKMTIPTAQSALANVYASDFNISIDGGTSWVTPVAAALDSSDKTNKTIVFTMPSGTTLSASLAVAGKIQVKTSATPASTDVYGVKLAQAPNTEGAGLTATNAIAPTLVSAAFVSPTRINVTFSGTLASMANAANSIQIVQGSKVLSGDDATPVQGKIKGTALAGNVVQFDLNGADALDPTKDITVRTVSADFMTAADANNNLLVANTTGVSVATFAASAVNATIAGGAIANADHFDITFNRNIDLTSIVAGWTNGATPQTATMTFNADGTASISGANVGTFKGLSVFTGGNATVQLTSAAPNTLTVTVTAIGTVVATDNGVLNFTPSSSIKSATGTAIGSYQVASAAAIDAKPFIVSAKAVDAGTLGFGNDANDQLILTFSEPVETVFGADGAPVVAELNTLFTGTPFATGSGATFTTTGATNATASNTLTIKLTANTLTTNITTATILTTAASADITDGTNTIVVAPGTIAPTN